jgi:hypothetical protein
MHGRLDDIQGHRVRSDAADGVLDGRDLVADRGPSLVREAGTEGTAGLAWSTGMVAT